MSLKSFCVSLWDLFLYCLLLTICNRLDITRTIHVVHYPYTLKRTYLYICCTADQASSCLRPPWDLIHRALDFGKTCQWQHLVSSHSVTGRSVQSSHWIVWKSWTGELYPSVRTSTCSGQRHTQHVLLHQHTNTHLMNSKNIISLL